MIKDQICKVLGHKISKDEKKCPYTLKTYQTCSRCKGRRVKPE